MVRDARAEPLSGRPLRDARRVPSCSRTSTASALGGGPGGHGGRSGAPAPDVQLSIDVINVLGVSTLGLHAEGAGVSWEALRLAPDGAALVNWLACLLAVVPLRLLPSAAMRILVRDSAQPRNTYSECVIFLGVGVGDTDRHLLHVDCLSKRWRQHPLENSHTQIDVETSVCFLM